MASISLTTIEFAKAVIAALAAIGALVAAGVALWTYRSNAEWKRVELANNYLKDLLENKELVLACRALDWHSGRLVVPESLQPLLKGSPHEHAMEHDLHVMKRAMDVAVTPDEMEKEPRMRVYRTAIDSLLSWLSIVEKALDRELFEPRDIQPIAWWLFRMGQAPYLGAFIRQYGYESAIKTLNEKFKDSIERFRQGMPAVPTGPTIASARNVP